MAIFTVPYEGEWAWMCWNQFYISSWYIINSKTICKQQTRIDSFGPDRSTDDLSSVLLIDPTKSYFEVLAIFSHLIRTQLHLW